jgi:hypothetical protein
MQLTSLGRVQDVTGDASDIQANLRFARMPHLSFYTA